MTTKSTCYYPIQPVTNGSRHHFFGFYDICPWDKSGRYLLAHQVDFIDRMPLADDIVTVGVIDTHKSNEFKPIGQTNAWNFQQGARLQWIPSQEKRIIYNIREGDTLKAVCHDLADGTNHTIPVPIYALHPRKDTALTLNFARLQRLGGYGYLGLQDPTASERLPADDGIYSVDFETDSVKLVIPIAKAAALGDQGFDIHGSHHYLTHILFNPSGDRFCFLHRFMLKDGGGYTRLITANKDGSNMYCLAEGSLSHFDWFTNDSVIIWGRRSGLDRARRRNWFTSPLLKPILAIIRSIQRGHLRQRLLGDRYLLFQDLSTVISDIGVGVLTADGHPTRFPGSDWLLTDTYPDKDNYRPLMLYNIKEQRKIDIGRFYALPDKEYYQDEGWAVSGMRSDLHPRWNRDQTQICIDSVHEGSRQMYLIDVGAIVCNVG